jgi:hypothetical protein
MNFLKSSCHCFHYEGALQVYNAIVNCAMIFQRHSIWRYWESGQLRRMKYLAKVRQFHVHVRFPGHVHFRVLSVSVSIFVSVYMSISVLFQFKYGALNIYGRHGNYFVNSQGSYEVAGKLEGPLI